MATRGRVKGAAVKQRAKGIAKQMKGNLKAAAGEVSDNRRLEARGKATRAKGRVQEAVGDALDPDNKRRRGKL